MNINERILLLLYYPQFNSPSNSRFETLFQSISKKDLSSKKNKINKSRIINPVKIVQNEDKRTSIVIKGIPPDVSKKEVRNILEKYGNLNYLYITKNINSNEDTSTAYVNVINYKIFFNKFNQIIHKIGRFLYFVLIVFCPELLNTLFLYYIFFHFY